MASFFTGFFDSVTGSERSYSQSALARAFHTMMTNGVSDDEDCLKVIPGQGLQVIVQPGMAVQEGYFGGLVDDGGAVAGYSVAASGAADRYVRVILRQSLSAEDAVCTVVLRDGSPGATPVPPALQQSDEWHEISLARVLVRSGASEITAADIIDERPDETVCGVIAPRYIVRSKLAGLLRANVPVASSTVAGLMASTDKSALDALKAKGNATSSASGWMADTDKSALDALKAKGNATSSASGWMAPTDKAALDALGTKGEATASASGWMAAADKVYLTQLRGAMTVSEDTIDLGGKYIDNALFR